PAAGNRKTIVEPVQKRDAKAPVDVIHLICIRQSLEIQNDLIQFHSVRANVVNQRKISVLARARRVRGADVPREIYPSINLKFTIFPRLTARAFINRLHQRTRRKFTWIADNRSPSNLPIAGWERRRVERGRWNASWVRRVGIGWRVCRRAQLLEKCFVNSFKERFV